MNLGNYLVEFMIITVHGMQLVQLPTDESAGSVTVLHFCQVLAEGRLMLTVSS